MVHTEALRTRVGDKRNDCKNEVKGGLAQINQHGYRLVTHGASKLYLMSSGRGGGCGGNDG